MSAKIYTGFGLLAGLASMPHALATDFAEPPRWEVSLLKGAASNSSDISSANQSQFELGIDSGETIALIVNQLQDTIGEDRLHYEYYWSKTRSQLDIRQQSSGARELVRMPVQYFHVGGTYEIAQSNTRLAPYVGATIGLAHFEPEGYDQLDKFSMSFTGGFRWPLTGHVGLRIDARALATFLSTDSTIFCSGGCVAKVESDIWWQYELVAGVVWKF